MVTPAVEGIDLFKIVGRSISGWMPSLKTGTAVRQPFCSQLEERLLLWLEYHPQVQSYARGDIGQAFATAYRLPIPKHAPFAIGYAFEDTPHDYLPDVVGTLTNGKLFIAEAGMEDDKRRDRNLAKAEAARRLARLQRGVFWIETERRLSKRRHYNLVFLHARRKTFPAFADIAAALHEVWPWGEVAAVCEVASRLEHKFPAHLVEAAIWKVVGDSAAQGHLLVDLEQFTLDRTLPLALLPPEAPPVVPDPLPDTLLPEPDAAPSASISRGPSGLMPGVTFDASTLPSPRREHFHRNLRAVELVLGGATQTSVAAKEGIPRSTLGRLVRRTRERGQIACVPHGSYVRKTTLHLAFQACIRRLYLLPTRLSMTAICEHLEMHRVATRLVEETGKPVTLPSYKQVRTAVQRLQREPELVAMREGAPSVPRARESAESFVLAIPAPALLTQVDEHTMDLYVVTPDGTTVASRVHAAVLVCVKTAAILGAVLALGPLKEEDYMRLVKQALEPKDHLVGLAGCQHAWPCFGKPAIVFHDRGKIFTSERARQVLVDRLQIITEQAPPYCPSAKGTVEALFRWMTQRFERRLPNTSYGVHAAHTAAQAGGMTLEALERCFYQAVVDDYHQAWDDLRRQRRVVLWDQTVAQSGVPQYLGSPDDLKLLFMKAVNRKTPHHGYRTSSGNRLSFHGRWDVCPGLLSRLQGREFEVYYDRRDVGVLYLFVEGEYVGEAYCPSLMGGRVSEWEARAMRKQDEMQARRAREQGREVRARIQEEAGQRSKRRRAEVRASEQRLRSAWHKRSWHVIVADPGAGKTMGIRDLIKTAGSKAVLAITAPKNNDNEMALGNQLFTALGLPLRGRWSDRKPKLMGHLYQYGTECLIIDDAHDLSLEHLMFIKELTDQGRLQYDYALGLCLVAAGRGTTIPLKETLDLPGPTWLQFRRRLDKLEPFCRVAGHTSEEVREILATLETVYQPLFPKLTLRQWAGSIYTWLTHPVLDPTHSGRVTMDYLMKLVTTALEWTYEAGERDVQTGTLEKAAQLLVLRRDTLQIIDGAGPRVAVSRPDGSEPGNAYGTEPQQETRRANGQQNTTQTVDAQVPPSTSPKCTFFGVVAIDLTRFADSGVALVECPDCSRMRSLSPHKGVLRFPSHEQRKLQTPVTGVRWAAKGKTDWGVVDSETK